MLTEEQTAELLRRCESLVDQRLNQTRGRLRKAAHRAAAIWELLVLEGASRIGTVEYEPEGDGSPDILLTSSSGEKVWIEAAFLYPRFWKQERQSDMVSKWIAEEAEKQGISHINVGCRFDGDADNEAGPMRKLPDSHQKNEFLNGQVVKRFFEIIKASPARSFSVKHDVYSIILSYAFDQRLATNWGLTQEVAKIVKQHAVYKRLKSKADQHDVQEPHVICLGSNQSRALLNNVGACEPTMRDAVQAAFMKWKSLSGVITVKIQSSAFSSLGRSRHAKSELFINPEARAPLSKEMINHLKQLDFNRWCFTFPLKKYDEDQNDIFQRMNGTVTLTLDLKHSNVFVEIPSNALIDSLAGKTDFIKDYTGGDSDPVVKYLKEGWNVKSSSFKKANVEAGEPSKVILELEPPPEAVFRPGKNSVQKDA